MPTINKYNRKTNAVKARQKHEQDKRNKFKGISRENQHIYNGRRWRTLRKIILNESPMCVECLKKNKFIGASVVDHILPINQGGAIYSRSNLQSLCAPCHNRKSRYDRKKNIIGEGGLNL
jgi:5-methylcytosine-specific restriction protein A